MNTECCVCGGKASLTEALEAEEDRRAFVEECECEVPIIGVLCDRCKPQFEEYE